jgi:hypothetical protein
LAEVRAASQGRRSRGIEDAILRLEAAVPGIGGFYADTATGHFTVLVRDGARRGPAVHAVQQLLSRIEAGAPGMLPTSARTDVDVRIGDYAFSELVVWQKTLRRVLFNVPEFLSIDADERLNRVQITVSSEAARSKIEDLVSAAGVPLAAVRVEQGTPAVALATLSDKVRPTGGGVQIKNNGGERCTLGWNVTTSADESGFLTASHCSRFAKGSGATGESMYQSNAVPNDFMGTVVSNPAWNMSCYDEDTGQQYTGKCTNADVLFGTSSVGAKRVARTSGVAPSNTRGTRSLAGWWTTIAQYQYSYVGQSVDKVGRTTGWTRGYVQSTCADVKVNEGYPDEYMVLCSDEVTGASAGGGDSGSPVFKSISTPTQTVWPLGVLFAGGPLNQVDINDNTRYCEAAPVPCTFFFSEFPQIEVHVGRYLYTQSY